MSATRRLLSSPFGSPATRSFSSAAASAEVVIVGSGIMGLNIAYQLRRRDPAMKITVLERASALGFGSSGYSTGFQRAYYSFDETMGPPPWPKSACPGSGTAASGAVTAARLYRSALGSVVAAVREREDVAQGCQGPTTGPRAEPWTHLGCPRRRPERRVLVRCRLCARRHALLQGVAELLAGQYGGG